MCILSLVIYYRLFVKSETPIWGVGPFIYCRIKGEGRQVELQHGGGGGVS